MPSHACILAGSPLVDTETNPCMRIDFVGRVLTRRRVHPGPKKHPHPHVYLNLSVGALCPKTYSRTLRALSE